MDGVFDALTFFENGGHFGIGSDSNVRIGLSEELRMLEVSQRLRDQRRVVLSSEEVPSNGRYLYGTCSYWRRASACAKFRRY